MFTFQLPPLGDLQPSHSSAKPRGARPRTRARACLPHLGASPRRSGSEMERPPAPLFTLVFRAGEMRYCQEATQGSQAYSKVARVKAKLSEMCCRKRPEDWKMETICNVTTDAVSNSRAHTRNYTEIHNTYEKSAQARQIPPKTAQEHSRIHTFVHIHKGSNTKRYRLLFTPLRRQGCLCSNLSSCFPLRARPSPTPTPAT